MKQLNQEQVFTLRTLVEEEMKRHFNEEGKQNRYYRKLARTLNRLNEILFQKD